MQADHIQFGRCHPHWKKAEVQGERQERTSEAAHVLQAASPPGEDGPVIAAQAAIQASRLLPCPNPMPELRAACRLPTVPRRE